MCARFVWGGDVLSAMAVSLTVCTRPDQCNFLLEVFDMVFKFVWPVRPGTILESQAWLRVVRKKLLKPESGFSIRVILFY